MTIPLHDCTESNSVGRESTPRRCSQLLALFAAFLVGLLFMGSPQLLRAQCGEKPVDNCQNDRCRTDQLLLNTGYNQATGTVYPDGSLDGYWTITQDANHARPVPRPANVFKPDPSWAGPLGNSQWIGPNPTADDDFGGDVRYEECFCVCDEKTDLTFDFDILAADMAAIYFDGGFIAATPNPGYNSPTHVSFTKTVGMGRHCIEVVVTNVNKKYSGLDIDGKVSGHGLLKYECCAEPGGEDLNDCQTHHLTLGTDDTWTIVSGPATDPLSFPRCADINTAAPYGGVWGTAVAGTNWIGRDAGGNSGPGCSYYDLTYHYVYRKSFCVDRKGTFVITITSMADDSCAISLNGVYLGNSGGYTGTNTHTVIVSLEEGCNCLEFDVYDLGCGITGLDALVDIQGGILSKPECCDCGRCTAGRGVARQRKDDNDALSAVPNNPASSLAPRPTLVSIPNPATGQATVHYVIDKNVDAQVSLYNTAGERVMVVDQGMRTVGEHAVPVITKGLPKGAYRLQLNYGGNSLSIPMNVE